MINAQIYKSVDEIDTGFKKHIDVPVDSPGIKPKDIEAIEKMLGREGKWKWFNVTGLGFDKNWLAVYGY